MGLPPHSSSPSSGSGHGPFGEKAFKGALIACAVLVVAGVAMLGIGGRAVRGVGTALIVICLVGLLSAGTLLLAERLMRRTPPPPSDVRDSNGRGRYRPPTRRR